MAGSTDQIDSTPAEQSKEIKPVPNDNFPDGDQKPEKIIALGAQKVVRAVEAVTVVWSKAHLIAA